MKKLTITLLSIVILTGSSFCQSIPDKDFQIKTAVLAAPENQRENATVLGYDENGDVVMLRIGSNKLICLADNPFKGGFSVASYHKDLEPYMQRGRELRKEGLNFKEIFDTREKEVKEGTLKMPDRTVLSVVTGTLNEETNELEDLYTRYVVYIPYATEESTGLPLQPATPGGPWIMNPGTHRAHIMINPPKD